MVGRRRRDSTVRIDVALGRLKSGPNSLCHQHTTERWNRVATALEEFTRDELWGWLIDNGIRTTGTPAKDKLIEVIYWKACPIREAAVG